MAFVFAKGDTPTVRGIVRLRHQPVFGSRANERNLGLGEATKRRQLGEDYSRFGCAGETSRTRHSNSRNDQGPNSTSTKPLI